MKPTRSTASPDGPPHPLTEPHLLPVKVPGTILMFVKMDPDYLRRAAELGGGELIIPIYKDWSRRLGVQLQQAGSLDALKGLTG